VTHGRGDAQPVEAVPGDELHFVLTLPAHPISVSVARHAARGLKPWLTDDRCERLELITSEAVTNALRHGTSSETDVIEFELAASPTTVRARVGDNGPEFSQPTRIPGPREVGGYGLMIISQLASSWQIQHTGRGNDLHFTV
jgi:anti-sigma regulatory factor (Ser/Thr protein kinase)